MNKHVSSKINQILKVWPRGTVAVQAWLSSQGISRYLTQHYVMADWLRRVGTGAFIQANDKVDWTGGLYAIQRQLNISAHVASITALEEHGYAHFIPLGKIHTIWLFKSNLEKKVLPRWMYSSFQDETKIVCLTKNLFEGNGEIGLTEKLFREYSIILSTPERAILEYLSLVPEVESYSQAIYLMEGLATLRPDLVQQLLEGCRSVKVKRLFMYLAEKANHPWVKRLDLTKVDFGKGKRTIMPGGRFNSKYQLSVPKNTEEDDNE